MSCIAQNNDLCDLEIWCIWEKFWFSFQRKFSIILITRFWIFKHFLKIFNCARKIYIRSRFPSIDPYLPPCSPLFVFYIGSLKHLNCEIHLTKVIILVTRINFKSKFFQFNHFHDLRNWPLKERLLKLNFTTPLHWYSANGKR